MTRVLYYAHDSGSGHIRHATNVARHPELDVLVVSGAEVESPPFAFRQLATDVVESYQQPTNGPFHYTPTGNRRIQERFEQLHSAMSDYRPDVVIADVSAEVAAFAKLSGYPTIVRRMHGDRHDRAHRNMYDFADALIAYYPAVFESGGINSSDLAKLHHVGMLSESAQQQGTSIPREIVVLTSLGGTGVSAANIDRAAAATPEWHWTVVGRATGESHQSNVQLLGVVPDPMNYLARAAVVVSSTGHNAVRAAVSASKPMILCPEPRMYDEQLRFAEAIGRVASVPVVDNLDSADWPALLQACERQGPQQLAAQLLVDDEAFFAGVSRALDQALQA